MRKDTVFSEVIKKKTDCRTCQLPAFYLLFNYKNNYLAKEFISMGFILKK